MSSQNNDIHTDIRDLIGTDTFTPEVERVVSFMRAYRPHVEIDTVYRNKLKNRLLSYPISKNAYTPSSWFVWMSWTGTVFATLIVTLGFIRIFFPEPARILQDTRIVTQSPIPTVTPMMESVDEKNVGTPSEQKIEPTETSSIPSPDENNILSTIPQIQSTESATLLTTPQGDHTPIDTPLDSEIRTSYMMGDSSLGKASMSMESDHIVTPTDTTSEIDSEIQDIIWEINTIIMENQSQREITVPDYPTEMPIYIKDRAFTQEEVSLLAGSGIISIMRDTYIPDILQSTLNEHIHNNLLTSTPIIRYISYRQGDQYILVPTLIYTTDTGSTIEFPLVPGY